MKFIRTVLVVSAVLTLSACTTTPKVQNMNNKANALYQSLQKKTGNIYRVKHTTHYNKTTKAGTSAAVMRGNHVPQAQPLQKVVHRSPPKLVQKSAVLGGDTMSYASQQPKTALPIQKRLSQKEQQFINHYYGL